MTEFPSTVGLWVPVVVILFLWASVVTGFFWTDIKGRLRRWRDARQGRKDRAAAQAGIDTYGEQTPQTNVVVQQRNANVSMAEFGAALRRVGVERSEVNSARRTGVQPPPDGIAGVDLSEAELRFVSARGQQETQDRVERGGTITVNIAGRTRTVTAIGNQLPSFSSHGEVAGESDTSLGVSENRFIIVVAPNPPSSPDPQDEECDMWVNTGAKPATISAPWGEEWVEVEPLRTPFRGSSLTVDVGDDTYVAVVTFTAPGLRDHLKEMDDLHHAKHLCWENMSPEVVRWMGGLTRRERTFLLSVFGLDLPEGKVPKRTGKRPVRAIDLG